MTFRLAVALVFTAATLWSPHLGEGFAARAARTLDIYFIDVEGGQSTLIVTPSGQSLLVDTGFPGHEGAFQSQPGDARQARDANRIAAAVRDAALKRIDFLLITHFHADHDGGAPELAALVPIRTFIDHGTVPAEAEQTSRGTLDAFQRYAAVRARARHIEPKPGDRLPLTGLVATVVSSARATLTSALDGAGRANASCGAPRPPLERQGVQQDVDTDRISRGGELIEVRAILAFALERVPEVGVVRHENQHVAFAIGDRARMDHCAVGATLGRAAAGAEPEAD